MTTPETCSGAWSGVKMNASLLVPIGANRTIPLGPTLAPRTGPADPPIITCSRPWAPGGRWMITLLTVRARDQVMVRIGCVSAVLATQAEG